MHRRAFTFFAQHAANHDNGDLASCETLEEAMYTLRGLFENQENCAGFLVMQIEVAPSTGTHHIQGYYEASYAFGATSRFDQPSYAPGANNVCYCTKGELRYRTIDVAKDRTAESCDALLRVIRAIEDVSALPIKVTSTNVEEPSAYDIEVVYVTPTASEARTESTQRGVLGEGPELQGYTYERIDFDPLAPSGATMPAPTANASTCWWLIVEPIEDSSETWSTNPDSAKYLQWHLFESQAQGVYNLYIEGSVRCRPSHDHVRNLFAHQDVRAAHQIGVKALTAVLVSRGVTKSKDQEVVHYIESNIETVTPADVYNKFPHTTRNATGIKTVIAEMRLVKRTREVDINDNRLATLRYIWGPPGVGKSHQARKLALALCEHNGWKPEEAIAMVNIGAQKAGFHDGVFPYTKVLIWDEFPKAPGVNRDTEYTPLRVMEMMSRNQTNINHKSMPSPGKLALDLLIITSNLAPAAAFGKYTAEPQFEALMSRMPPGSILELAGRSLRDFLPQSDVYMPCPFQLSTDREWVKTHRSQAAQ